MPSSLGHTLKNILEAHADENVRAFQLAPLFEVNPVYTSWLLAQPMLTRKVAEWTEEDPKRTDKDLVFARRSLSLLGKSATRNFAASARLIRSGEAGTPRKKTDRVQVQPAQLIPSALAAENFCLERSWVHSEIAFWAGLHYDWITALVAAKKAPKEIKTTLYEAFREGVRMGQIAYDLARQLRSVKHGQYVFGAAVLAPIGKGLLSAAFPGNGGVKTWAGHLQSCEKLGAIRPFAEEFLQKQRFGTTSVELSSLYVLSLGLFSEVEPAIRYSREPWMLEGQPDLEQLAMMLSIAGSLAVNVRLKKEEDLPLSKQERAWLAKNKLSEESIRKTLASVVEVRIQ